MGNYKDIIMKEFQEKGLHAKRIHDALLLTDQVKRVWDVFNIKHINDEQAIIDYDIIMELKNLFIQAELRG